MEIVLFFGMTGIGKTTFVKRIFEDPLLLHHFDHRVWISQGPRYQPEEILVDILAQIYPDIDKIHMKGGTELAKDLCTQLSDKRCLIMLDNLRDKETLHFLKKLLPDIKGKLLVTTRLAKVQEFEECDKGYKMRLLNIEQSWFLLRQKVFAEEWCPPELEKVGRKIAENCDGLPLTILMFANLLSKAEKSLEYWNKVAGKQNSVFMDVYDKISNVILPSYKIIPQHIKACFLYMGVFGQNYEIPTSKLINLWIAEGLLEPNLSQTLEDIAIECLLELVNRSLVMVYEKGSNFGIKTCRLRSIFWHLSNCEAVKNKIFYALNTHANNSIEGLKSQHRFCIHTNILFGIKDVQDSTASISITHSLLFTSRPHKYPVTIYFSLRLLRILDTLTIRFYEFPIEVLKLIHLKYLAFTYNGNLPASLSKLWNLEYLIISRHLSIKSFGDSLYLPLEIWDMKELKHLQIMGSNLLNPNHGAFLPYLLKLLDVSAHSCTEGVLKRIPNLKRLGIQIELVPDDDGKPFHCLNHVSCLTRLESLKCVIVNPEVRSKVVTPPAPTSMFSPGLKKLSLNGLGYPWEYMSIIGKLQNLEVLKLRCYAFQGPEWETNYYSFMELKYLLIEDTDLEHWKIKRISFQNIKCLRIKHCYNLEELPHNVSSSLEIIEVVDCNPSVVTWAKQMKEMCDPLGFETFKLQVQSSWDVANLEQ